jgi:hypothetical protein
VFIAPDVTVRSLGEGEEGMLHTVLGVVKRPGEKSAMKKSRLGCRSFWSICPPVENRPVSFVLQMQICL